MKKYFLAGVIILGGLTGCATEAPHEMTSLQLQSIQSREFNTNKATAFASVVSVFQDLGYIVDSASLETGFITAKSPTKGGYGLFGSIMRDTKATAFVEQLGPKTRVRLNFVNSVQRSSSYGMKQANDTPIQDPALYQNAFSKIQQAIFIRSAQK